MPPYLQDNQDKLRGKIRFISDEIKRAANVINNLERNWEE